MRISSRIVVVVLVAIFLLCLRAESQPVHFVSGTCQLPPIPDHINSVLGRVPVYIVDSIPSDSGETTIGLFQPYERKIYLQKDMDPSMMWETLEHEKTHMALAQSAVSDGQQYDAQTEETIADAIAVERVHEMLYCAR